MNSYYKITKALSEVLQSHANINTVVIGNLSEIDAAKQNIYPLAQIVVGPTGFENGIIRFNVKVLCMDLVVQYSDLPDHDITSIKGSDNKQDVYNSMLAVVNGLQTNLKRGILYNAKYQLDGFPTATPFEDSYGNLLTGWMLDFTLLIPNNQVSSCMDYTISLLTMDSLITTFDSTLITF